MHSFALSRADDPANAIAAHAQDPHLAFIAGGTDLIGLIKDRAMLPERFLDINHLPDMALIEVLPDGGLHVGVLMHMSDVAADMEVRRRFPIIAEALLFAASGQLRNQQQGEATSCSAPAAPICAARMISPVTNDAELDVSFVGEFDEEASPMGAKGLGVLTAVSVAPAIANAVYHAFGKRIRDLPITVEKLLS
jgi:hypothetical protein